ncbi:MAG: DUF3365 domain-containing protein [Planctomycetes bacterium]|nr:DUF3365 domain-containing protein [Planctomycetota bacterium]
MFSKMNLMAKFIATTIVAVVICTGILTYINTKRQKTQMLEEVRKQARSAADQLISTRKVIAEKQKAINTDSKGNFEFKGVIPAIVGREIAEHFSQTTIFKMKQTSLKYRNPNNKPDAWEIQQLERFESNPDLKDFSETTKLEDGSKVFRLMVPLKIEEACMKCHGDPANSSTKDGKDIAGRQMENYKVGDIRGGISVIAPLATINAAIASNNYFNIFGNAICVIVIGVVVFLIARNVVSMLKRLVVNLMNGSKELTSAAKEISSSSQSLADGASQQASSIEETSASIEEMASMTTRNADNAKEANQLAVKTKMSAEAGNEELDTLQTTMKELNAGNDKVLSIIKSIDEIAFQTNLLALNAAVEAARAGEHGKGFAVVAEEVRSLAQRCSVASKETADLINSRVISTENAAKIAEKSASNLKEIVTETKKVTDLSGEIATASQEQSEGINQISKAISTMDTVTQQNAANAEELAASSEELTAQAESLKTIVAELATQVGDINVDLDDSEITKSGIGGKVFTPKKEVTASKIKPAVRITEYNRAQKLKSNGNGSRKGKKTVSGTPEELIPLNGDFTGF